jgi:hypothetical protein
MTLILISGTAILVLLTKKYNDFSVHFSQSGPFIAKLISGQGLIFMSKTL